MDYKTCTKCGIAKEAVPEEFRIKNDKFYSQCRACERVATKKYAKENKQKVYETRKKYRENNREKVAAYQKEYEKTYRPKYYEKNKELLLEKQRQYRKDNEAMVKKKQREYYQKNKEWIKKRNQNWRNENKEKMAETIKKWWKDNKPKRREYNQTRRAKVRELVADLTVEQWEFIQGYFDQCCAYCGEQADLCQDHFVPVNSGGGYTISNIIPACQFCNSSKHDKDFFEWYPTYKHYDEERVEKLYKYFVDVKVIGK